MAHFDYEKPGGVWGLFALLSSAIMQRIDKKLYKAINGDEGGTWAPTNPTSGGPASPITIGGDGLQVLGPFLATDASIEITNGKFLTLDSGATFDANLGSFTFFKGTVSLRNQMDVSVSGPNTGAILFEANTYLQLKQDAQMLVESGGIFDLKSGAIGYIEPGAVVLLTGSLLSPPNLEFGSFASAHFGTNSFLSIDANATLRVRNNGDLIVDLGGDATINGTLSVNHLYNVGTGAVGTWHGAHTFKSDATLTLEAGLTYHNAAIEIIDSGGQHDFKAGSTRLLRTGAFDTLEVNSIVDDSSTRTRRGPHVVIGDGATLTPRFKTTPNADGVHMNPSQADYWTTGIVGADTTILLDHPVRPCVFMLIRQETFTAHSMTFVDATTMAAVTIFGNSAPTTHWIKFDGSIFTQIF